MGVDSRGRISALQGLRCVHAEPLFASWTLIIRTRVGRLIRCEDDGRPDFARVLHEVISGGVATSGRTVPSTRARLDIHFIVEFPPRGEHARRGMRRANNIVSLRRRSTASSEGSMLESYRRTNIRVVVEECACRCNILSKVSPAAHDPAFHRPISFWNHSSLLS